MFFEGSFDTDLQKQNLKIMKRLDKILLVLFVAIVFAMLFSSCDSSTHKECKTWKGEIEVEFGAISDNYRFDSLNFRGQKTILYWEGDSVHFLSSQVVRTEYKIKQECIMVQNK